MTASSESGTVAIPRAFLVALELALLLAILALAAYLRLANNAENPAWYSDEATQIDIAQNLVRGRVQYMAIQDSTLLVSRMPLFNLLVAAQLRLAGANADAMVVLRTFTGWLGVLTVALLYLVMRRAGDAPMALMAAFVLAIFPQAVLYNRFGFSYNLLAPLVMLALLGLWAFAEGKRPAWLALAALAIGLGIVSDLWALTLAVPFVIIVIAARRPLHLLWSLPLLFAPFALYCLWMLSTAPDAFLFDFPYLFGRLGAGKTLDDQIANLANNYRVLLAQDLWMPAGFIGLFALRPARLRWAALLLFWLPFAAVGRIFALYNLSAYYLIPLLPFIALGVAALLRYGGEQIGSAIREALGDWGLPQAVTGAFALLAACIAVALLVGVPLAASASPMLQEVHSGFPTAIDPFLINTHDARTVADYVNSRVSPDDVIIVSPVVGWMLHANVTDFQMTAAAQGRTTPHLPDNVPAARWAFDPVYTHARYVIVDNLWRNWGVANVPGIDALLQDVQAHWTPVLEAGELAVYENPLS
jgi:4-amino-4-deoxy-L-arabinose transferase-like glycosyltransferase